MPVEMAVPQSKSQLLDAIEASFCKLRAELVGTPASLTRSRNLPGHRKGTSMSVCNLVSYLIGWNELVLKWHREKDRGREPVIPEAGFKWTELGQLAQKFYEDYGSEDYPSLLKHLTRAKKRIAGLVMSKTNEQLYGSLWYRKATMGQMIQLNTASPYRNAFKRIRRWKNAKARSRQ